MTDEHVHRFSDKERVFFQVRIEEINRLMLAVNESAKLIAVQNELPGEWQLNLDGSGLTRIS